MHEQKKQEKRLENIAEEVSLLLQILTPTSCCEKRKEMNNKEQEEKLEVGATEKINFFMGLTFNKGLRQ